MKLFDTIALEGCDAVGKSTLAKQLSNKLNLLVVQGSSFENAQQDNAGLFQHFIKVANVKNVIFDRTIYSNRVYATLYNDYSILSDTQRKEIEKRIKDKTIVVHLTADTDTIINRINTRGDDYVTSDKVKPIVDMYTQVMQEASDNGVTVLTYDTSKMTTDEIAMSIMYHFAFGDLHEQNNK